MATPPRRWFRLDVGWSDSDWLAVLEPAARLAWIELLGYVKTAGMSGIAKAVPAAVFGRNRGIPTEAVQAMLDAAATDGALIIEGKGWLVANWFEYQEPDPTAAERQRRHRAERSRLSTTRQNRVTDHQNGTKPVTRDTRDEPVTGGVTRRVTETETETDTTTDGGAANAPPAPRKRATALPGDWQPNDAHRQLAAGMLGVRLSVEVQKFRDHFTANGKPMKDWDAAFRNWLRRANEFAAGRAAPAGSEAASVREELPRSTTPRHVPDPLEERRRQDQETAQRVAEWAAAHPDEDRTIRARVKALLDGPALKGAPAGIREGTARAEYARLVMEQLRPSVAA